MERNKVLLKCDPKVLLRISKQGVPEVVPEIVTTKVFPKEYPKSVPLV